MTKPTTQAEIEAAPIMLATSCSWRRFVFDYPYGGPFAEPITQHPDNHPDIYFAGGECTGHRLAACWNACIGMADPKSEIERLRFNIERLSANPADHRYWEGRWRDEAAENERLRAALRHMVNLFEDGPPNVSDDDCERAVEGARKALGPQTNEEKPS